MAATIKPAAMMPILSSIGDAPLVPSVSRALSLVLVLVAVSDDSDDSAESVVVEASVVLVSDPELVVTGLVWVDEAPDDVVAGEPEPDFVSRAVVADPMASLDTHPTVLALVSTTPTRPVSQQKPLPSLPMNMFQLESAQTGAPSTAPVQSLGEEQHADTSRFLAGKQWSDDGQ